MADRRDAPSLFVPLAAAAAVGAAIAAVADLVLQIVIGVSSGAPVTARLVTTVLDWSPWVGAALLLYLAAPLTDHAPRLTAEAQPTPWPRAQAFDVVGTALIVGPAAWLTATVLVRALAAATLGSWDVDGQALLELAYYSDLMTACAPWALAGAGLRAVARHL